MTNVRNHNGVAWLPESYSEGFTVVFCAGETSEGLVRRLGADGAAVRALSREQAEAIDLFNRYQDEDDLDSVGLDLEELQSGGFIADDGEVARVGEVPGWAYAIESFGAALNDRALVERASAGTRLVAFRRNVNTASWLTCAVDGRVVCSYDPLHPDGHEVEGFAIEGLMEAADRTGRVLQALEAWGLGVPRSLDFEDLPAVRIAA
ncbi:DUF6461 domain-containing protein [Streptomyces roseoverticillatus]|uniref:DUF6461 domain-containing protein n=1 Tax=Streptomyces roseoverticillatus TaxID=66429 RepID=A0ABV3IXQ6_9ACTN